MQRRAREKVVLGAARCVVLFASTGKPNIHRSLKHQLWLIKSKILHPRRHIDGNVDIVKCSTLRFRISPAALPRKRIQPQTIEADVVHIRDVSGNFRINRRPHFHRVPTERIHILLCHLHFAIFKIDVVFVLLISRRFHQLRFLGNPALGHQIRKRRRIWRKRHILHCAFSGPRRSRRHSGIRRLFSKRKSNQKSQYGQKFFHSRPDSEHPLLCRINALKIQNQYATAHKKSIEINNFFI